MNRVKVIGPKDPKDKRAIITTSINKGLGGELSPFRLGPVKLYKGAAVSHSQNVENAWQFSKVYKKHINNNGDPSQEYYEWAKSGWSSNRAYRYPMGKGAVPEYSWWGGKKLGYIEARKRIYLPLYAKAVQKTKAFKILKKGYDSGEEIILWDFDGYDYLSEGKEFVDVINDPSRPLGHAFIVAGLLEGKIKRVRK